MSELLLQLAEVLEEDLEEELQEETTVLDVDVEQLELDKEELRDEVDVARRYGEEEQDVELEAKKRRCKCNLDQYIQGFLPFFNFHVFTVFF